MRFVLALAALLAGAPPARADIVLGAILFLAGPGAGLGIPERNTIPLLPETIAGQKLRWVAPITELRQRGFAGPDALRVGGTALDGVMFSSVSVLVAEQIAADNAVEGPAMAYVHAFETADGQGNRSLFGAPLWDGEKLIEAAAQQVSTLAGSEAVFSLTPTDHGGAQADSQVMMEIRDSRYRLLGQ